MSIDNVRGAAEQQLGRLEEAVGDLIGDPRLQARGMLNEASGAVEQVFGLANETAQGALSRAAIRTRRARDELEDFVGGRPVLATGIALGIGIAVGALLIGGGRAVRRPAATPIEPAPTRRRSQSAGPEAAANRKPRAAPA
jgi:uncharacterized protein YjbJ (UPF0337 family)